MSKPRKPMEHSGVGEPDLVVDAVYGGSRKGNSSDDPLPILLGVDNGAGFRHLGKRPAVATLKLLVLTTRFADPSWPDSIDRENGHFIYYGDKRTPGHLDDTPRQGNQILQNLFAEAHSTQSSSHFPPILLFASTGSYRDMRFLGLAVPGIAGMSSDEDLVAVWRTTPDGVRFQNYRSLFTILDVAVVSRSWINDAKTGNAVCSPYAPAVWLDWVKGRKYSPLLSQPTTKFRTKSQQLPASADDQKFISLVHGFFKADSYAFERCAMEIARLFMPNIHTWEITRPWRDGGRDAVGTYRLGSLAGGIDVEFALEAKCFALQSAVGVKPLSRLLSRLRHRQFGILVTTSYLGPQAYDELVADGHPVVVISAIDIAQILKTKIGSIEAVQRWLQNL